MSQITNKPSVGDHVKHLDLSFKWTKEHISIDELEYLRLIGDDLAQNCLPFLKTNLRLNKESKLTNESRLNSIYQFLKQKDECPKPVKEFYDHIMTVPEWVDFEQIRRGQTVYWSYFAFVKLILLNCSLVGGFAAKRITSTLSCTAYLSNPNKAFSRLLETALFTMDCMSFDELKPGGKGWLAALNVRMMHAQVRNHVLRLPKEKYDLESNGIPVNQEDLLSTTLSFSYVVLAQLERMGIPLTEQEKEDYLACWRYIAYLLGVKDENQYLKSFQTARCLRESIAFHLFEADENSSAIALNVLKATANQPPFYRNFYHNVELTRYFIGDLRGDSLKLPHSPIYRLLIPIRLYIGTKIVRLFLYFNKEWVITSGQNVGYRMIHKILGYSNPSYHFSNLQTFNKLVESKSQTRSTYLFIRSNWWVLLLLPILILFLNILFNTLKHQFFNIFLRH